MSIIWNTRSYTVVWVQEWESKKNNNKPYITVNLSDEYGNAKTIFEWITQEKKEIVDNLRLFQKWDSVKMQEVYSAL